MRLPILLLITLISCNKSDRDTSTPTDGTYEGTFKRYHQEGSQTANVRLTFTGSSWSGASNINKYPALGSGAFTVAEAGIKFNNKTVWTADFDWTLILDGDYIEMRDGDSLRITKSYGNGWVDVYRLKRK